MISDSFSKLLAAGRAQFNQRVIEGKRRFPAFDHAAFADFLTTVVDRVVCSVADIAPERVASVVLFAYDIALELIGQTLVGPRARSAFVGQVWHELIPKYAALLAENPSEVLSMLTNAAAEINGLWG